MGSNTAKTIYLGKDKALSDTLGLLGIAVDRLWDY